VAAGYYSYAAGQRAKSLFQGDFVWADSQPADFASTGPNQFLIRATNGVGINKNNPGYDLDVYGSINSSGYFLNGSPLTSVSPWVTGVPPAPAGSIYYSGGNVGIGTINPHTMLELQSGFDTEVLRFGHSSSDYHSITTGFHGTQPQLNYLGFNIEYNSGVFNRVLTIEGDGAVGINTPTPAAPLEVSKDIGPGLGPVLRLNRSSASGNQLFLSFADGDNDIAGMYVPAGSDDLRFNNGHADLMTVTSSGRIGVGTISPGAKLHVYGSGPAPSPSVPANTAVMASGDGPDNRLMSVNGNQSVYLSEGNGYGEVTAWDWVIGTNVTLLLNPYSGAVGINTYAPDTAHYALDVNGPIHANGNVCANNVSCSSDRNAKESFEQTDPAEVLRKVVSLPITKWNFKQDATRHLGPMAQDFYEAFQVGTDNKHIGMLDEGGVALAAIQGLNEKVEADNAVLKAENEELKARLTRLEQILSARNGGAK